MKTNLTTDLTYQNDSIVSKTILKNEGGNITLFSFDAGQALSEHTAPFDALLSCFDGNLVVTIDTVKHSLKRDDLIILPAGIPHAVYAVEPSKCMLVMIKIPNR
jgi:quercetin dioxygenase-like cupin family protein